MKWLKRKLRRWLQDDSVLIGSLEADNSMYSNRPVKVRDNSLDSDGFNLKVFKANGGTIIETHSYNRRKDESSNGLYVITDDKDLGNEIGKIITMEGLKL